MGKDRVTTLIGRISRGLARSSADGVAADAYEALSETARELTAAHEAIEALRPYLPLLEQLRRVRKNLLVDDRPAEQLAEAGLWTLRNAAEAASDSEAVGNAVSAYDKLTGRG